MRLNSGSVESQPLFSSSYKSSTPTFFTSSSATKYDSLSATQPYTNGKESLTKTYINKFENYSPTSTSNYSYLSDRPYRSHSPSKYESLPATQPSPTLASKFPRYFGGSANKLERASPSLSSFSGLNSTLNDESPSRESGYISSSVAQSSLGSYSESSPPRSLSTTQRYTSLPPLNKSSTDDVRSPSPLFSTFTSRADNSSYRCSGGSPKSSNSPSSTLDSSSSSFLKLARLNLTPVKFRAKRLTALG